MAKESDLKTKADEESLSMSTINIDMPLNCMTLKLDTEKEFIKKFRDNVRECKGLITPIGLHACQGNHKSVEFLIRCGSQADNAIYGYLVGGYLKDKDMTLELLNSFSDFNVRQSLINAANKILSLEIPSIKKTCHP